MSQKEEKHSGSLYYVIPAQVFEDERLESNHLKLYALISGLAHSNGYCFASNDYLAQRMRKDIRSIQRWIDVLESTGYIKREITKNGIVTGKQYPLL